MSNNSGLISGQQKRGIWGIRKKVETDTIVLKQRPNPAQLAKKYVDTQDVFAYLQYDGKGGINNDHLKKFMEKFPGKLAIETKTNGELRIHFEVPLDANSMPAKLPPKDKLSQRRFENKGNAPAHTKTIHESMVRQVGDLLGNNSIVAGPANSAALIQVNDAKLNKKLDTLFTATENLISNASKANDTVQKLENLIKDTSISESIPEYDKKNDKLQERLKGVLGIKLLNQLDNGLQDQLKYSESIKGCFIGTATTQLASAQNMHAAIQEKAKNKIEDYLSPANDKPAFKQLIKEQKEQAEVRKKLWEAAAAHIQEFQKFKAKQINGTQLDAAFKNAIQSAEDDNKSVDDCVSVVSDLYDKYTQNMADVIQKFQYSKNHFKDLRNKFRDEVKAEVKNIYTVAVHEALDEKFLEGDEWKTCWKDNVAGDQGKNNLKQAIQGEYHKFLDSGANLTDLLKLAENEKLPKLQLI